MTIQLYRIPQRADLNEPLYVHKVGDVLTVGTETFDLSTVSETPVTINNQWIVGPVWRADNGKVQVKLIKPYAAGEDPVEIDPDMPDAPVMPAAPMPAAPVLFASAGFTIANGLVTLIELAAHLTGAFYEDGWVQVYFASEQNDYLIFPTTDIPCKVEQFKASDSFELVFSDGNDDPVEPGRIDLQILKVVR